MEKIGSSHIALPDLIIFGVAFVLFHFLRTLPPNSSTARVLAVIAGLGLAAIVVVIPVANDLTRQGAHALYLTAVWLALGLWDWNKARTKANLTPPNSPEAQSSL